MAIEHMDGTTSMKGFFIVLEGIDGCGKTVHSKALCKQLKRLGYDAAYTTEPSNSRIGRLITSEFLRKSKVPPQVEALLFAADRFDHLSNEVLPMIDANKIVISDRYFYSSLAYQGAQGLKLDWIRELNNFAVKPDLALYLDVPAEVGLARKKRKSVLERLELEKKVRDIYLSLVDSGELVKVDSSRDFDIVRGEVLALTLQALRRRTS